MAGLAQLMGLMGGGGFPQPGAAAPQMGMGMGPMGPMGGMPGMIPPGTETGRYMGMPGPEVYQDPGYANLGGEHVPMSKEEVAIWRKRIVRSHRAKKDLGLIEKWRVLNAYYEGRYFSKMSKSHQIATNWMFAQVRSAVASLYYENPTFFVTGLSDMGREAAPVVEQVMEIERRVMRAKTQEERWLLHGLKFGIGVMKHGYSAEAPVRDMGAAGDEYADEPRGVTCESDLRMKYGHPWKIPVAPWNFGMDPDAEKPELARWYWHRFWRPFVDVREDDRLDPEARAALTATGRVGSFSDDDVSGLDESMQQSIREDASMVCMYEIYDVTRKRVILLCDNGDAALLNKRYAHFGDMTPYEFLVFYEAEEHPWGLAWAETFRSQVEVINLIRSEMLEHLDSWGRTRVAYLKNAGVSEADIKKFLQTRGSTAIGFTSSNGKLSDVFDVLQRIEINPDAWKLGEAYHRDMVDVSGSSELGRQTTETATESIKLDEKQGLRIGHMRTRWDEALDGSAHRDIKSLAKYWGPERSIPLLGPDGQLWTVLQVPFMVMNSEYLLKIQPGSTEKVNQAVRTRQIIDAMDRLQQWVEMIAQQGYQLNVIELMKNFLKQTEVFRNPERLFIPIQQAPQLGAPQPGVGAPQLMSPAAVNGMGGMPWEQNAGVSGRTLSEMFGGGMRA